MTPTPNDDDDAAGEAIRPCVAVTRWPFLTGRRLAAMRGALAKMPASPLSAVLHPVLPANNGFLICDFYDDHRLCFADNELQLQVFEEAGLGNDRSFYFPIDDAESEQLLKRLHMAKEFSAARPPVDDLRALGPEHGYYLVITDFSWWALQLGTDPRTAAKLAALPSAHQPRLEVRTSTPEGQRVFSIFRSMPAWFAYLELVAPMYEQQGVKAHAYPFIDRAHEMTCDGLMDPGDDAPYDKPSYWEPPTPDFGVDPV